MEVLSSYNVLVVSLFVFLFPRPNHCQQAYLNDTGSNCSSNAAISKGYLCDGHVKSCNSFVTFRSREPYDTPINIAYLLGSDASEIYSVNNISSDDKIPTNKLIVAPISCTCSGNIYEHLTPYTVKKSETYYITAQETYQGLTTCQAMISRNYYDPENIPIGSQITVPVRCACPSPNQTASGVTTLLTYLVDKGETVASIGKRFGVNRQSILEANMLSQENSTILPSTPILVPLKRETCSVYPEMFFCKCRNGYLTDESSEGFHCISDDGKSIPVKLVTLLGILCPSFPLPSLLEFVTRLFMDVVQTLQTFIYFHRYWHWICTVVSVPFWLLLVSMLKEKENENPQGEVFQAKWRFIVARKTVVFRER